MKYSYLVLCLFGLLTACDSKKTTTEQPVVATVAAPDTLCFVKVFEKDSIQLKLIIVGDTLVTGQYNVLMYQKDSGRGTLKGTKQDDILKLTYNYVIEGSNQIEETEWKLAAGNILKKRGQLMDCKDGVLRLKDSATATYADTLMAVNCQKIGL